MNFHQENMLVDKEILYTFLVNIKYNILKL